MRVRVVRRGGLAGIAMRGEADTAELAQELAQAAEERLHRLPVDKPPAPPRHPDGFQYELAFSGSDGESRSVSLDESELPEDLRPLIEVALKRHGTLG